MNDENDGKGHFGYKVLAKNECIPYIYRGNGKFCATPIFQWHIDKLNVKLDPSLAQFPFLTGLEMNFSEATLWNEINQWHNNYFYPFIFRPMQSMVQLKDICDIYKFVKDCDQKSRLGEEYKMKVDVGLIQIRCSATSEMENRSWDIMWPYIGKDGKRYIPLAILPYSCQKLSASIVLDGIDVMYMRYLYTILKRDIPRKDFNIPCIDFDAALTHSLPPSDTVTYAIDEQYWPTKTRSALIPLLLPQPVARPLPQSVERPLPRSLPIIGSHIKKLNNNNLAYFQSKAKTNDIEPVKKNSDAMTTQTVTEETAAEAAATATVVATTAVVTTAVSEAVVTSKKKVVDIDKASDSEEKIRKVCQLG